MYFDRSHPELSTSQKLQFSYQALVRKFLAKIENPILGGLYTAQIVERGASGLHVISRNYQPILMEQTAFD